MNNEAREPHIIDLYPNRDDLTWYGIYHRNDGEIREWHIKAQTVNESLGEFFIENVYSCYFEILDHIEIA